MSGVMMTLLLGEGAMLPPYRPFIDPIQVHEHWWMMVVPMALGVAVVYKAVRMPNLRGAAYPLAVLRMMVEILAGMAVLAGLSYAVVMVYARWAAGG